MKLYIKYTLFQSGNGLRPFLEVSHAVMDGYKVIHHEMHREVAEKSSTCEDLLIKWQEFLQEGATIQFHGVTDTGIKWLTAAKTWNK